MDNAGHPRPIDIFNEGPHHRSHVLAKLQVDSGGALASCPGHMCRINTIAHLNC